jgi:predicted GIY-YIG superfamily endonuclease
MMRSWIYILRCADNSCYTGCTTNLEQRICQHHEGIFGNYTSSRRPLELVYIEEFNDVRDAIRRERQIKHWSRAKKEALICGNTRDLRLLARSTTTRNKASLDSSAQNADIARDDGGH